MLKYAIIIAAGALCGCGPSSEQIAAKKAEQARAEKAKINHQLIEKAEEQATHDMLDPGSVQFRNVSIRGENVCGELNGKNSYGAYTGFHPFESSWKYTKIRYTSTVPEGYALQCAQNLKEAVTDRRHFRRIIDGTCEHMDPFAEIFWQGYKRDCEA